MLENLLAEGTVAFMTCQSRGTSNVVRSLKSAGRGYRVLFANGDLYHFYRGHISICRPPNMRSVAVGMTVLEHEENDQTVVLFYDGTLMLSSNAGWSVVGSVTPKDDNALVAVTGHLLSNVAVMYRDGTVVDLYGSTLAAPADPHPTPGASLLASPNAKGLYIVGSGGWVESVNGDLPYHGSLSRVKLNGPIVDGAITSQCDGYWLLGSDGGVFTFGSARFHGSLSGVISGHSARSILPLPDGSGYWILLRSGKVYALGNCAYLGSMIYHPKGALAIQLA